MIRFCDFDSPNWFFRPLHSILVHYFPSSSDYGYAQHDIAVLFVAGFGSSMIFGTFVGGMADQFGRRLFVIVYGLTYAASCFTKRTYCARTSIHNMFCLNFVSNSALCTSLLNK